MKSGYQTGLRPGLRRALSWLALAPWLAGLVALSCGNARQVVQLQCPPGEKPCPGGCQSISDPAYGCASASCDRCSSVHATASCAAGECALHCDEGWAHCGLDMLSGCETDITASMDHCGGCNEPCAYPNASAKCVVAECVFGACDDGFVDCDDDLSTGCESDPLADADNCGSCGISCSPPNGFASCDEGTCVLDGCYGEAGGTTAFGDCNGFYDDGCEVDLRSDSQNCGVCGRVCPGTECTDKLCDPVPLFPLEEVYAIELDASSLYWVTRVALRAGSKNGGPVIAAASYPGAAPLVMTADDTYIYYGKNGLAYRVQKDWFGTSQVINGDAFIEAMAVDSTYLYWLIRTNNDPPMNTQVWRADKDGSNPVQLAAFSGRRPYRIAVGSNYVFWTDTSHTSVESAVQRVPIGGGQVTKLFTVAASDAYREIEADSTHIYWLGTTEGLMGALHDGTGQEILVPASETEATLGLRLDGVRVYYVALWPGGDRVLSRVRTDGTGQTAIAYGSPRALAIDSAWVYFPTGDMNTISKAQK